MSTQQDETTSLEYWVTGLVILFFGLLYYFLNYGLNNPAQALALTSTPATPSEYSVSNNLSMETPETTSSPASTEGEELNSKHALNKDPQATTDTDKPVDEHKVDVAIADDLRQQLTESTSRLTSTEQALAVAEKAREAAEDKSSALADLAKQKSDEAREYLVEIEALKAQQAELLAEKNETTAKQPEETTYRLPDNTEVALPASGFEQALKTAIINKQYGQPIIFDNITFESGSDRLNTTSTAQVKTTAALLNSYPDIQILLRGHSDNTGQINNNTLLSLGRSKRLKDALVEQGIDEERLQIEGVGPMEPIAPNDTEANRQMNRRIELVILE